MVDGIALTTAVGRTDLAVVRAAPALLIPGAAAAGVRLHIADGRDREGIATRAVDALGIAPTAGAADALLELSRSGDALGILRTGAAEQAVTIAHG